MGQLDNAYDLAIIGSGGAAFGAAIEARRRDARVVMVEHGTVGGTCVNVGCVPSKTLLAGARAFHTAASHPFAGLPTQTGPVDLAGLVAQKDDLVADMRQHKYCDLAKVYDFEIIHGGRQLREPDQAHRRWPRAGGERLPDRDGSRAIHPAPVGSP
jgi:mercuric reductase